MVARVQIFTEILPWSVLGELDAGKCTAVLSRKARIPMLPIRPANCLTLFICIFLMTIHLVGTPKACRWIAVVSRASPAAYRMLASLLCP